MVANAYAASGRRARGVVLASFNAALLGDTVAHAVCDLLLFRHLESNKHRNKVAWLSAKTRVDDEGI